MEDVILTAKLARSWGATGRLVYLRTSEGKEPVLAEVWQCFQTGELDYRPLPLVDLSLSPQQKD
jgi:hypothetical protein